MNLRIALLYQKDNFVGSEYFNALSTAGIVPNLVAAVGQLPKEWIAIEQRRTAGRWNPPTLPPNVEVNHFHSLNQPELWRAMSEAGVDVAIQGGIGILKENMLRVPKIGFLNVHPGRLPTYRGNACPEWALNNGDDIYATAHLIDEGIDTGPVICERQYEIRPDWDYFDIRANLYSHCASVLLEALAILDAAGEHWKEVLSPQDREAGFYWPRFPENSLMRLIKSLELEPERSQTRAIDK